MKRRFAEDDDEYVVAEKVEPTPFQQKVLSVPEQWNLLLAGGRGGGKSKVLQFLILRHVQKYGRKARVLYIRQTLKALTEFEEELNALFVHAFGKTFHHNRQEHLFRLANGAMVELGQLETEQDYTKYQGRSFTFLIVDEYGAMTVTKYVWLLSSNLRSGDRNVPLRMAIAANPGGAQHGHINVDFISKSTNWTPFEKDPGDWWMCINSTFRDNPHIDPDQYIISLRRACGNDEELLKAWISGDWNIARGAYFSGALDEKIHKIDIHPNDFDLDYKGPKLIGLQCPWPVTEIWCPYLAGDWGSGAPAIVYVCAESPGVDRFPKGSLILVDELAIYDEHDTSFNTGLNWPPSKFAEGVHDLRKPWSCPAEGVCDDAYGLEDSLLNTLTEYEVYFQKPKKERISGWQAMRNMLLAVKNKTGQPGMYISARCNYFWRTVPYLLRDPKRPEDIITKGVPDHGADAARYGAMHLSNYGFSEGMVGDS